jgi:hypothetical protein
VPLRCQQELHTQGFLGVPTGKNPEDSNLASVEAMQWVILYLSIGHGRCYTNEVQFTRDGITNTRNSHSWAHEHSHEVAECHFQHRFSVNVWCGVLDSNLTGPRVIEGRLTAPYYSNFLENKLQLHLEDVPLATRRRMWLQHDGAHPHFGRAITEFLNEDYEARWIGRGGPLAWPARSPNLNPLDFFLWGT